MTTPAGSASSPSALERWSLLGGAVYVVLFIVGSYIAFHGSPNSDATPEKIRAYWADSSHRSHVSAGWLFVGVGVFLFIWFVAALRQRVRDADTGFLSTVVLVGGALYATSTMAAFSVEAGMKTMSDGTYQHAVYPEISLAGDSTGYVLHAGGAVGISALIIAASVASMRLGRMGRALGIVSIVAGVISLGAIAFFPTFVLAAWLLVASIVMFIRSGRGIAAPA
jgi:hypothetical protein